MLDLKNMREKFKIMVAREKGICYNITEVQKCV